MTRTNRLVGQSAILGLTLLMTACGGSSTTTSSDASDSSNPSSIDVNANRPPIIGGLNANYVAAALSQIDLNVSAQDLDGDELSITWSQEDGAVLVLPSDLHAQTLSLTMPVDQGVVQSFTFKVVVSDGQAQDVAYTTITVPTTTVPIVADTSEPNEQTTTPSSDLVLTVDSINSRGIYEYSANEFAINFSSVSGAQFDITQDYEITLFAGGDATRIQDLFVFDDQANRLYIPSDKLSTFNDLLSSGDIEIGLSAYDTNSTDLSKEIRFMAGYGRIEGQLLDNNGETYTSLVGHDIELRGGFIGKTYVAKIDDHGRFVFADLPADTYNISLVTNDFKVATASVLINDSIRTATISPIVVDMKNTANSTSEVIDASSTNLPPVSHVRKRPASSEKTLSSIDPIAPPANDKILIKSLNVSSAKEGQSINQSITVPIPKNITEIEIVATVVSKEYPDYTTVNSPYNDTWQFGYFIPNSTGAGFSDFKQGNVNSTHASNGEITYTRTLQVNGNASSSAPDQVTLYASATNIGDDVVPVSISLNILHKEVSAQDYGDLHITHFMHREGLGEYGGRYYLGIGANSNRHWIADIKYQPENSQLSSATCKFKTPNAEYPISSTRVTHTGYGQAELDMAFSGLSQVTAYDNTVDTQTQGRIECDFEALDTNNSIIATSAASYMELATGIHSLIPLARYIGAGRFGGRDIGGDDWMRANARAYMSGTTGNGLLFNDASREHGGCFVTDSKYALYNTPNLNCTASIRDHESHMAGTSVDIRYPVSSMNNPVQGGLRQKLAQSSSSNAAAVSVKNWVNEAREKINVITTHPTVKKVYIAKEQWLKDLLNNGVDESGSVVPGLTAWDTKSGKIMHYQGHDDHVHIEFF